MLAIIEATTHEVEDIDIGLLDEIGLVNEIGLLDGKLLNKEFPEKPMSTFFLVKL
ncbi:MAG: hypothetical protein AB3K77_10670 [Methanosarcinaceae archaeon]|uniref:hypothetical protein n=1 Tax=Methanosarcina sp. MTP4 TaxID=1434100 RepID=UPI000AF06D79|nr:hypothetical protein [Methanosarcina sp. MTP4]